MEIKKALLTNNECYIKNIKLKKIKGIMIHSTACPGVKAKNFVNAWNVAKPNGSKVCVHGFLDDEDCYQTLPFENKAWHSGGFANDELLGFELCEPKDYSDREYFEKVKRMAVELCVFLCNEYKLTVDSITTHCEAFKKHGRLYASNHGDIDHWWKKYFGYTMDNFRAEVLEELNKEETQMKEEIRYNSIDEVPDWGKPTIEKLINLGLLNGNEYGDIDISHDMLRVFVINDRANLYHE